METRSALTEMRRQRDQLKIALDSIATTAAIAQSKIVHSP